LKISAILLSRVLAFIDTAELRPTGGLHAPDFVEEVAKQFEFQKFPQAVEEFNIQKGMVFLTGRIGAGAISKLTIWPNILVIEGRSSTTECKEMLNEILHWAAMKFELTFTPEMITRYAFVSDLSFTSDAPLLTFDPLLSKIAERVSASLSELWLDPIHYELFDLRIGHDPLTRKWGIAPFQIARLAEHRFTENKYFSEAPLPTDLHIELLEEYEAGILDRHRKIGV
jgi:hypothetical protein